MQRSARAHAGDPRARRHVDDPRRHRRADRRDHRVGEAWLRSRRHGRSSSRGYRCRSSGSVSSCSSCSRTRSAGFRRPGARRSASADSPIEPRISCCRRSCLRARKRRVVALSARLDELALAMPFTTAARARGAQRGARDHSATRFGMRFCRSSRSFCSTRRSWPAGAVVTESVFAWPGIGGLFTESLAKRDYTVLMAFLMCGSVVVAMLNLVADVAVHAIDPRTREAV